MCNKLLVPPFGVQRGLWGMIVLPRARGAVASSHTHAPAATMDLPWNSRRSPVFALNGMTAATQPLATQAGLRILQQGGNAADAAVAMAAVMGLTEPTSTGIGGDAFALYFDAATGKVSGINGSGRSPAALSLEWLAQHHGGKIRKFSPLAVTVPGAAAAYVDTIEHFGSHKLTLAQIFEPAIQLARQGFPVAPLTAEAWARGVSQLHNSPNAGELLIDGQPPKAGQVFKNANLAATFEELATKGKEGFYSGRIAESIVSTLQSLGGVMTLEDLAQHRSTFDEPIHVNYRGVDVYEIPPNGQGITALIALNLLEEYDLHAMGHNSTEYLHTLIEALRLAFADSQWYVTDPTFKHIPIASLLSKEYAAERRKLIDRTKATIDQKAGSPVNSSDTVYFCVADGAGNACSFINSNYMGFGTGIIPAGCGFPLQNRGHNFSMVAGHPNALEPNKRPYHTIIPGMATKNSQLFAAFGVMGGFMQPQGHVQVLANMIDFGMNPQTALDAPRFCIGVSSKDAGSTTYLEEGISESVVQELNARGHHVQVAKGAERSTFGRGQIIYQDATSKVLVGGSDPRGDGMAAGY